MAEAWCTDGAVRGYANLGEGTDQEWWVCAQCKRPTRQVWETMKEDGLLNYFRGGPIDGLAYETSVLLSLDGLHIPITDYHWTPEIVVSERTGKRARVWVAINGEDCSTPEFVPEGNQYLRRRKALRLSRGDFAEAAGISPSQVTRLEMDSKVKPGTREAVEAALTQLEGVTVPPV